MFIGRNKGLHIISIETYGGILLTELQGYRWDLESSCSHSIGMSSQSLGYSVEGDPKIDVAVP
jgi:hypothetical protein